MKKIILISLSALAVFFLTSCEEIMPVIPSSGSVTGDRVVLIEEFTGVGCQNCPAGSAEIENLLIQYPENLVAVSIHAGFFAQDFQRHSNSKYDLRSGDGNSLVDSYFGGEPAGYPSATLNRELTNNGSFFRGRDDWAAEIITEIGEGSQVTLGLSHTYDEDTRSLGVDVDILPLTDISSDLRITIMITESGIVDYQKDLAAPGDGWVADYVHKHVLRDIVTSFDGEQISTSDLSQAVSVQKSFSLTLPDEWVPEKCNIIAFVHKNTSDSKEVLQAIEKHVID